MGYLTNRRLEKNIETYCSGNYNKDEYFSKEDCIAKQRLDYGIDMTMTDKVAIGISLLALLIGIIAMFYPKNR